VSKLILEFPMNASAVTIVDGTLLVDMGNGVRLVTEVPAWATWVTSATLTLTMEVEGSPTDVPIRSTPIG
jgi:DMSO reductase anchor subunit